MSSDFAEAGKRFEKAIPVPELQLASIRNRARVDTRHRFRVLIACALIALALGSGTVLAAMKYGGVRIWFSGDKAAVSLRSFTTIATPTGDDLRRVVADATFPVVLPVGAPKGMHLIRLFLSPTDRPNFIGVQYANGEGSTWQFALFDSLTVSDGAVPLLPDGEKPLFGQVVKWNVGRETVVTSGPAARLQQAQNAAAMLHMTPAQSLAQTLPRLYRITILGGLYSVADAADAIAPAQGRNVLVDRGNLGQVASLARNHRPLLDFGRMHTVENLPIVAGRPDFAHQVSGRVSKDVALSADSVRALATVLASGACGHGGRMGSGFTCEMLVNERSGQAYRIWALPLNTSNPPKKYVVGR